MNTKLTLSLEKEVIEKAKIYAKGTGRSLSEMVENYFRNLVTSTNSIKNKENEIEEKLKRITGIVTLPDDFDIEKVKEEYHREKYGI
jgi:Family of unknown function (DUF6364)